MKITEDLVKSLCNKASLRAVQSLNLSDKEINGSLDCTVLEQLANLSVLDISQNSITDIPESFSLNRLETLDCSFNNLKSLQFIQNFKNCTQLYLDGNDDIQLTDKVKAFRMNSSVHFVDEIRRSTVENFKEKFEVMVKSKWEVLFAAKYAEGFSCDQFEHVLQEFYTSLTSDLLFKNITEETEWAILKDIASEIVEKAQDKSLFNESNMSRGTPRSARLNHKWLNRNDSGPSSPSTPESSGQKDLMRVKPLTPKSGTCTPASKPSLKRGRDSTPTSSPQGQPAKRARDTTPSTPTRRPTVSTSIKNTDEQKTACLPSVGDFDPAFFIRCHSTNNDPNDNQTKVWRCAFKPSNKDKSSRLLATCGGQNVCLIDCQTGIVMKRYKDSSKEEDFYALAWSTIPYKTGSKEGKINILAVAGNNGYIKLIHPSQFVMYATMEGHHDYVSCLLFHPEEPTHLFSGSKDRKIILWDVGVPDFTDYTTNNKKLMVFNTAHTDALNLVFSTKSQMLIAGCEKSCYGWRFNNKKSISRDPNFEFLIPSTMSDVESGDSDDVEVVDGLALLPNDYIAAKCNGSGHMVIWNLHDNLPVKVIKGTRTVEVKVSALLQYTRTSVDYINLSSTSGMLTAGDDKGSLFIYQMGTFTKKHKSSSDQILGYSSKLLWPDLDVSSSKGKMEELPDCNDIVINSCCSSDDQTLIACGTDNNLVCIWKKNPTSFR
ncbi:leucine-rich repeat and WD repeat-containing protein 1-like [Mytilus californianus]|uniref:leucine-rich repeat and WD repeat-containing protein 1-like n=1 Tax=Mytilus californianus TaxID=6549 RepID=UPI002245EA53|nr:leucine-rich repeat and WD repeat-containing protein 1-like [Mytilus californianus]